MNIRILRKFNWRLVLGAVVLVATFGRQLLAAEAPTPTVRIADLEINSAQIDEYKTALKEEIETSIRLEPGVVALNAVAEKDNPTRIRIFEIYGSQAAYRAHIETPHFKRYKISTQQMVRSLKLVEAVPILLGSK